MTDWLPPKSHYVQSNNDRAKAATAAVQKLVAELNAQKSKLDEHELSVQQTDSFVELKRYGLEFVTVVFNYDNQGSARVTNQLKNILNMPSPSIDFQSSDEAIAEFKVQVKEALETFYAKQGELRALGLI